MYNGMRYVFTASTPNLAQGGRMEMSVMTMLLMIPESNIFVHVLQLFTNFNSIYMQGRLC